ncbi:MAG: hypothetical protein HY360_12695 [Verrucomicrobia bacterium]|nr:hypothetical protein [Verrucomicrobiota bacterium]
MLIKSVFGANISLEGAFGHFPRPLVFMRLLERVPDGYNVTTFGAYWIHRLQNEYNLNYTSIP